MLDNRNTAGTAMTRVLVVDDALVMRRSVEKMLRSDYEVVLADDGEAGWEVLNRDDRIKMLITDIQMPRLDGYGLICRVRADNNARIRDLPIITITGAEDDETKARAYACGSTDFITKPFNQKLLQARVDAYLRLKQAGLTQANAATAADEVDPVTRLGGLGHFIKAGQQQFARAQQAKQDLAAAALDIDEFDHHQRQHGKAAGDALLAWFSGMLTTAAGKNATLARVGEAEFAMIIPALGRAPALELCEQLRTRAAAEPFKHGGASLPISVSIGLVTLNEDAPETFDKLLALVEQRLSQARSEGGDRVSVTTLSDIMPEPEEVVLTGVDEAPREDVAALPLAEVEELAAEDVEEFMHRAKPQG